MILAFCIIAYITIFPFALGDRGSLPLCRFGSMSRISAMIVSLGTEFGTGAMSLADRYLYFFLQNGLDGC